MLSTTTTAALEYSQFRHALLLGEADFSFARAFASQFEGDITATEYGSGLDVCTRYHDSDNDRLAESLSSLKAIHNVRDVIVSLNARVLAGDDKGCTCDRWNSETQSWDTGPFWHPSTRVGVLYDLVVFNFPHTPQYGKASRLVAALFHQLRACVEDGRFPRDVVLEMRLRSVKEARGVRAEYKHEEAAAENEFALLGTWPSDLELWQSLGYEHRITKRNATCRAEFGDGKHDNELGGFGNTLSGPRSERCQDLLVFLIQVANLVGSVSAKRRKLDLVVA